jgi:asparagine synthase (glutamine-hydrolysing)
VYYVSKLARDSGVIVCQVGEGADELFWGYPSWKLKLRLQQLNDLPVPNAFRKLTLAGMALAGRDAGPGYEALRRASQGRPIFWGGADAFTETQKQRLLSPRLRGKLRGLSSWTVLEDIHRRFRQRAWEPSPLNWMTYLDVSFRLPELLLMRVDKMTMGVSLEGRVPFLDHKFVELAMGISQALKTRRGVLKYILKKSVRGLIPDELIDRPKQGFGVPVYEWFFQELGRLAETELEDFCHRSDFFDPREVRSLLRRKQGPQAWYLLNFALWWKQYIGQ